MIDYFNLPDGLGHSRAGGWSQYVSEDAVLFAFNGQTFRETDDTSLRRGVLCAFSI
jgi:hypothetical protein